MRLVDQRLREKVWNRLNGTLRDLNGFSSREEFDAAFADLDEVAGDGSDSFVCRKEAEGKFNSSNMILVNVERDIHHARLTAPVIGGQQL